MAKTPTKAERGRMTLLAATGCQICGLIPCSIHHVRRHGEKRKHGNTIGLCWTHHQGPEGIHHLGRGMWERLHGVTEADLLVQADGRTRQNGE